MRSILFPVMLCLLLGACQSSGGRPSRPGTQEYGLSGSAYATPPPRRGSDHEVAR
ncbi:MAG: hypothetical protein ACHQAY_00465 [Hyphomicrobiales bacterium]